MSILSMPAGRGSTDRVRRRQTGLARFAFPELAIERGVHDRYVLDRLREA